MKKILCIIITAFLLVSCEPIEGTPDTYSPPSDKSYVCGVWVSFSELDGWLLSGNFKNEFETVVQNCKARGITDMFVHTRPFCDSIYPSKLFPMRESVKNCDFDILQFMIDVCHQNSISFHAWINPYRVRTSDSDWQSLPQDSPAYKWLADDDAQNDVNISICGGIYLNPTAYETRELVINGIREIITQYDVDGIHFDDYFYPTADDEFDRKSYEDYCTDNPNPLSLDDWRRANVNALISGSFTAVKFVDADILFSISPSASVTANYQNRYADIALWIESGCVDVIIPQLYFGFEYPDENFKFDKLLTDWEDVVKGNNTRLFVGLASYKINTATVPDSIEWSDGLNIINRQINICEQNPNVSGHVFFSYNSMIKYK